MKISEKEELLVRDGKLHAILRWEKQEVKIGDILFELDGITYKLTARKRWKVFRCGAERSHIDFSCDTIYDYKTLITHLYGSYGKVKDDTIYLMIFKADKSQQTLGL